MKTKIATENPCRAVIRFSARVSFRGSVSQYLRVTSTIKRLGREGLMLGTWPTPDGPLGKHLAHLKKTKAATER